MARISKTKVPAEPANKPAPAATEATQVEKSNDDGRIAKLEKRVDALHHLLHLHGIRHKAGE